MTADKYEFDIRVGLPEKQWERFGGDEHPSQSAKSADYRNVEKFYSENRINAGNGLHRFRCNSCGNKMVVDDPDPAACTYCGISKQHYKNQNILEKTETVFEKGEN